MSTPLQEWQKKLEAHFGRLSAVRSKSGLPLFALEHGLNPNHLAEISNLLGEALARNWHLASHWLVWVVYATEYGYRYYGDEYWPSFQERTPLWQERGDRNKIRRWFGKFQADYNGVVPSGPWAEHFSIIAWPITHAILPRDLQGQFAKALYDARYSLARLDDLSANAAGALLAKQTWDVTSRFKEFLQQEELVGRIVLALLSEKTIADEPVLYEPTLRRIVTDLEEVRNAKEWLKDARRIVSHRFKGASVATTGRPGGSAPTPAGSPARPVTRLSIRPNFLLRPSTGSKWSLVAEFPSLAEIANLNRELRAFIKSTRCKVLGSNGNWLPAGWLSLESRQRVLKDWPGFEQPLLSFERGNPQLDNILNSETTLPHADPLLFRISNDGIARHSLIRLVRPGGRYILLSTTPFHTENPMLALCSVDCSGIHAAKLFIPQPPNSIPDIKAFNIQVARTIRIWPAGLGARNWDGEGQSEWLTTEAPAFGITHDYPLEGFGVRINGGGETVMKAGRVGSSVFLQVPLLPAGTHSLSVKVKPLRTGSLPFSPQAEGNVTLHVREPLPWVPGTTSHNGLIISVQPADPTLDLFLDGHVTLSAMGPAAHTATCTLSLSGTQGNELLREELPAFALPITNDTWNRLYRDYVSSDHRSWTFMEAATGQLTVTAGVLGRYVLRLERSLKALRWACRHKHGVVTVRLIDDTGNTEAATVSFVSFKDPSKYQQLETQSLAEGLAIEPPGGLFLARSSKLTEIIIINVPQAGSGFGGLLVDPVLRDHDVPFWQIFELLRLWSSNRLQGPLVALQRDRILNRLLNCLYSQLCGRPWANLERSFIDNPAKRERSGTPDLQRAIGGNPGFSAALRFNFDQMERDFGRAVSWYADVATRYQVSSNKALCEFAVRLAGNPLDIRSNEFGFGDWISELKRDATVLRGARFLALLCTNRLAPTGSRSLPEWKWS